MKNNKKRIAALIAAGIMMVSITGCQPTPEKEAVVNKSGGIPSDALVDAPQTDAPARDSYEPMTYKVSEHWKEDITKDEKFSISADVDVMVPDVETLPVQKLTRMEMTQERVDALTAHFIQEDGFVYYEMPTPLTKEYYEAEILRLKEYLASVEAGGDGETPESIRNGIREAEKQYAAAPAEAVLVPAELKFTYLRDYNTGEPRTEYGENDISVGGKGSDGVNRTIYASRSDGTDGRGNSFSYGATIAMDTESMMLQQEEYLADERARIALFEDYPQDMIDELEKGEARIASLKEKYAQNTIDMDAMQKKAANLLKELEISGVQITQCEKALFTTDTAPTPSGWGSDGAVEPTEQGCYITFSRQNGGVPVIAQMGGGWSSDMSMEGMYSAPFSPESGSVLFDAEGNVKSFMWYEMAQESEQVSADSKLLPFAEAKERAADHLYWRYMPYIEQDEAVREKQSYRFVIEEARLVMTYINVKNEPEAVMAVPAWQVKAQGYSTWLDGEMDHPLNGVEMKYNEEELFINALDGSPVLMPGMQRMMEQEQESKEQMTEME